MDKLRSRRGKGHWTGKFLSNRLAYHLVDEIYNPSPLRSKIGEYSKF